MVRQPGCGSLRRKELLMKSSVCARMVLVLIATLVGGMFNSLSWAQGMPKEYQDVITYLGRKGDYKEEVLRVSIPRNEITVTVAGVTLPTPFGFAGWVAMTKGNDDVHVMMGDLVLLQDEVN